MKKNLRATAVLLVWLICCGLFSPVALAFESAVPSAILMDLSSGRVLYEKDADQRLPMASTTKMMTLLLAAEAVERGEMSLSDEVTAGEHAASQEGSGIGLTTGETLTVDEIFKSVAIVSANDAAVMLAEHVAENEDAFVLKMNQRAVELGLTNTRYQNPHGLDTEDHYSSARDLALLAKELLTHETILPYLKTTHTTIRNGSYPLQTTNWLLSQYEGAFGVKTGTTTNAGNCLVAAAEREDFALLAVVLNADTTEERFSEAQALLDYGYQNFTYQSFAKTNEILGETKIKRGTQKTVSYEAERELGIAVPKGTEGTLRTETVFREKLKAPIEKGAEIGEMVLYDGDTEVGRTALKASETVEKNTIGRILKGWLEKLKSLFG